MQSPSARSCVAMYNDLLALLCSHGLGTNETRHYNQLTGHPHHNEVIMGIGAICKLWVLHPTLDRDQIDITRLTYKE